MAAEQISGADTLPGPHVVNVYVGRRVRERRILYGLSQERLGAAIGVSFQQVQKYESGANRISASRLFELSHALDVPVSFFFGDMPEDHPPLNSKGTLDLLGAYYRIADGVIRKSVLDLIKSIAPAEG